MNINAIKSNLYVQNNQSTERVNQSYNKQNVAFSGLETNVTKNGAGKTILASVAALGMAALANLIVWGAFTEAKDKNIEQTQLSKQSNLITSSNAEDEVTYTTLADQNPDTVKYDMAIKTKSGNTAHIPVTMTETEINYGLPTSGVGNDDVKFNFDFDKSTPDSLRGDLSIKTSSGNERKFPFTIATDSSKKIALKFNSVDLTKLNKN